MAGNDSRVRQIVTGHSHVPPKQGGFTIVELIAVMIIIGVLGAVAASRFFERSSFDADAFTEQTRAMLRYGQKLAVAQNRPVYVRINTERIDLCFAVDCSVESRVNAPSGANSSSAGTLKQCLGSGSWFCESVPDGVTQTVSGPAASFAFDALGKPYTVTTTGSLANFQRVKVTITDGSEQAIARTITVYPETGYVSYVQ